MADKNKGGRPPKFDSAKELDKCIQHYFDSITKTESAWNIRVVGKGKQKKEIREPVLNNAGDQVTYTTYFEIPSITGLCQHIGITRDTWKAYEAKDGFIDSIKRAKERIEKYNVEQLYRRDQVTGIIFNLKNNFGWVDKQEVDNNIGNKDNKPFEVKQSVDDDEIERRLVSLGYCKKE